MSINGYQFDRAKVTAQDDASFNDFSRGGKSSVLPKRGNGMAVSTSGLSLTVESGQALISGRLVEVLEQQTLTVIQNFNGFLVISVNLSVLNDSIGTPGSADYEFINNQLKLELVNTLTNQDIQNGGLIYMLNLGAVTSNLSVATFTKNNSAYDKSLNVPYGITATGQVEVSGNIVLNNRNVVTALDSTVLWTGGYMMNDLQTVTPSKPLNLCQTGWVLCFRHWDGSSAVNGEIMYHHIPKHHTLKSSGSGIVVQIARYNGSSVGVKYLYVTNTTIKGNALNQLVPNNIKVLTDVFEY
jgi:hypothetical protein